MTLNIFLLPLSTTSDKTWVKFSNIFARQKHFYSPKTTRISINEERFLIEKSFTENRKKIL